MRRYNIIRDKQDGRVLEQHLYGSRVINTFHWEIVEEVISGEEYVIPYMFISIITNGNVWYRKGIRYGWYAIDYSVDGGDTWELDIVQLRESEDTIIINIDDGVDGYREVVRGLDYCIDHVLTPTGFAGSEGTDWENIFMIKQ